MCSGSHPTECANAFYIKIMMFPVHVKQAKSTCKTVELYDNFSKLRHRLHKSIAAA